MAFKEIKGCDKNSGIRFQYYVHLLPTVLYRTVPHRTVLYCAVLYREVYTVKSMYTVRISRLSPPAISATFPPLSRLPTWLSEVTVSPVQPSTIFHPPILSCSAIHWLPLLCSAMPCPALPRSTYVIPPN